MQMQAGDEKTPPYGAFLSWRNHWHAWGNLQAVAAFQSWNLLKKPERKLLLQQTDYFLPWQLNEGFFNEFALTKSSTGLELLHVKRFPQIAYGIRPMVWSALQAYEVTGRKKYARLAGKLAGWFFGNNPAGAPMYSPETGRCYDGIIGAGEVNRNSGAESTIEALLALQEVLRNPIASQELKLFIYKNWKNKDQN